MTSAAEFERLLANLQQEFQPEGPLEAGLVVEVAACIWRLRRATSLTNKMKHGHTGLSGDAGRGGAGGSQ